MNFNPTEKEIDFINQAPWQAPDFYKKHGYKIISELNDIPKGNKKYHLIKELNK